MPGEAWVTMLCYECLVGVVTFVYLVHSVHSVRVLCGCGVVAFRWRVLLGSHLVAVIFYLRFIAATFLRRWPALVVAWPYLGGG
jgi:hypothetical protein